MSGNTAALTGAKAKGDGHDGALASVLERLLTEGGAENGKEHAV